MKIEQNREPTGTARLLIDIGPLLVFFLVNFLAPVPGAIKVFVATGAFMAAMVVALCYAAIRYRYVSPLLLFSAVMVVVLGGLTISSRSSRPSITDWSPACLDSGSPPGGHSSRPCSAAPTPGWTKTAGAS